MAINNISKEIIEHAQQTVLEGLLSNINFTIEFYEREAEKEGEKTADDEIALYMYQFCLAMQEANTEILKFLQHFKF